MVSSNDNNVIDNSVSYCYESGIFIENSNENNILKNSVFPLNDWGIVLGYAFWNNISENNISKNNIAVYLHGAENNNITSNNFSLNEGFCLNLWNSINNHIYHNNLFKYMAIQASDPSDNGNNWDNGYPSGGNYWSDFSGIDLNCTPNQDIPPSDGLGDTPYVIDLDSQDNYPLMLPFTNRIFDNYTILKQGWNLISIPLIQNNQGLSKVLEMIDGYYDAVQWYDNSDPTDPWKHNKISKPLGNDLNDLNENMSFWIHITNPGDTIFLYNGTQPLVNQTIQLHPGWNMVGYPSLTSHNRTTGLNNLTFNTHVDAIQWFDAATKTWHFMGPDDSFVPGRGYWVHSKVEIVWEIPI
jgi:parallel beta-helix repeat protein